MNAVNMDSKYESVTWKLPGQVIPIETNFFGNHNALFFKIKAKALYDAIDQRIREKAEMMKRVCFFKNCLFLVEINHKYRI